MTRTVLSCSAEIARRLTFWRRAPTDDTRASAPEASGPTRARAWCSPTIGEQSVAEKSLSPRITIRAGAHPQHPLRRGSNRGRPQTSPDPHHPRPRRIPERRPRGVRPARSIRLSTWSSGHLRGCPWASGCQIDGCDVRHHGDELPSAKRGRERVRLKDRMGRSQKGKTTRLSATTPDNTPTPSRRRKAGVGVPGSTATITSPR